MLEYTIRLQHIFFDFAQLGGDLKACHLHGDIKCNLITDFQKIQSDHWLERDLTTVQGRETVSSCSYAGIKQITLIVSLL